MDKRKFIIKTMILLLFIVSLGCAAIIYAKIKAKESMEMGGSYDVLLHRTGTVMRKEEDCLLVQSEESLLAEGKSEHSFAVYQTIWLDCTELRYINKEEEYVGYDVSLEDISVGDSVTFYFFLWDVHNKEEVQIKAYAITY